MALGGRELRVILTSDVDKFRRGLRQAEGDAKTFGTRMKGIGKAAGLALAGAAVAAGGLAVKFGQDGVQAFLDDEAAAKKLATTLKNLGKAQDTTRIEDYIDKLSKATGVADDELRPAFEKLIGATGDTDAAMRLLSSSVDTSVGSGQDLATTAGAIAKAVGPKGTLGALKRLFPGLDTTKTKAGDAEGVLKILNSRFSGQAAQRMDTYAGKTAAVATAFGELQESFGRGLLSDTQGMGDALGGMDDTLYTLGPAAEELGKNLAVAAGALAQIFDYATKLDNLGPDWLDKLQLVTGGTLGRVDDIWNGGRFLVGRVTGNEAAANAARNDLNGIPNRPSAGGAAPQLHSDAWDVGHGLRSAPTSKTNVDPNRTRTRERDAAWRADARTAQRSARTRP